ncbi:hypothetical protein J8655_00070 [Dickeya oryzae]|uniref:hypothetical protein n=1 Tax=Dickeya oryzae TaxID=1240404 RepID=UPI001AECA90C|nr:hypothetical protein [Dickeya oryzae]MBP2843909.1 hypothetical protein [Dickeya oryzae]
MSKSLIKRCQRRWRIHLKPWGDSKVSPYWSKADIKSFARESGKITADCLVAEMAENNAKADFAGQGNAYGWSPEFSRYFDENRGRYTNEALHFLTGEITIEEIDDSIDTEIDCWEA